MSGLTGPQRRALTIAAAHDQVRCSNRTDEADGCISAAVASRLADLDLIELGTWDGRCWSATITEAGRELLAGGAL